MINGNTNKKFKSKYAAISSKTFLAILLIVVIVTSPISATNLSFIDGSYAEQQQQQQLQEHQQHQSQILQQDNSNSLKVQNEKMKEDDKKGVFHTLTSIPSSSSSSSSSKEDKTSSLSSSTNNTTSNNAMHKIEMVVVTLPTGQPAYKMISHVKSNGPSSSDVTSSNNNIDLTPKYSKLATIPGPTLVFNEGDYVKVNIKDKDGNLITSEEFPASQPGTFLYVDDSKAGENGLFGAVIVNPKNNVTTGLIKGEIQELPINKIDKDVLLFMVGSTF